MATVTADVFTVIQSYGGMKEAYFEVTNCTAADVINFTDDHVSGGKICFAQGTDAGMVKASIGGTDDAYVTLGAGPANTKVIGTIKWKTY